MKPSKVKVIAFHNAASNAAVMLKAVNEAIDALANIGSADDELQNAQALKGAATMQAQSVVDDFVASGIKLEPRASNGTVRKSLLDGLRERQNGEGAQLFTDGYITNLVGDFAWAVNNKPHKFILNHAQAKARANGKGTAKGKGGKARLVQKSDSAYSLNAMVNTPTGKLVGAVKQFGNWLKSTAKADDTARLALAAYLVECDDVAAETK